MSTETVRLVATVAEMEEVCTEVITATRDAANNFVTLDTEFIRTNTYFPQLALVQVGIKGRAFLLDYVRLRRRGLRPFLKILRAPDIIKVFHASRQDCEVLLHALQHLPAPIFDTQIAAALLGYGTSIGYESLVESTLGITLDKGCQRSSWLDRPLTGEQITYAAHDVSYLVDVYKALLEELHRKGRLAWAISENLMLMQRDLYESDASLYWEKFPFVRKQWKQAFIAKNLAAWREAKAIALNRPRSHILPDQALFEFSLKKDIFSINLKNTLFDMLAGRKADVLCDFWREKGLFDSFARLLCQLQTELESDSATIRENMRAQLPEGRRYDEPQQTRRLRQYLRNFCDQCAQKNDVALGIFARKHDFELWVHGTLKSRNPFLTPAQLSKGWRKDLLKNEGLPAALPSDIVETY